NLTTTLHNSHHLNHHHHLHNHNHHNSSLSNSSSTTTSKSTLIAITNDDESSLPLLPFVESSTSSASESSFNHQIHPDKSNPKGLRFEEEPSDSYIVRSKSALLRCRTLNALNAWFTCNSGDERRIQQNQKISNYVDPQTGIRLIEIDLEITRSDVEEHQNSGYTNPYQCWCTAYGGHHQIMSRKASVSFAYLKKHFPLEPKSVRIALNDVQGKSSSLTVQFHCQPPIGRPKPIVFWMRNDVIILESEHGEHSTSASLPSSTIKSSQDFLTEKFHRRKSKNHKKIVITKSNKTINVGGGGHRKRMAESVNNDNEDDDDEDEDYEDDDEVLEFDASKQPEKEIGHDDDEEDDHDDSSLLPDHFDLASSFRNVNNNNNNNGVGGNGGVNRNIPINYHMANDYTLVIKNITENDQANYTCGVYNYAGVRFTRPAMLTVFVNGEWSNWGSWSPCQLSNGLLTQGIKCGIGTQKRIRHCSNPTPVNNGQFCPGESIQITECTILCPPIDGFWSPWSQWSICSHDCTQIRRRICNNPLPQSGGHDCFGQDFILKNCTGGLCRKIFDPTSHFIQSSSGSTTTTTTTLQQQQQSNDQIYFIIIFILILIILTFVIYIVLKYQFHRRRHNNTKSGGHSSIFNHNSWLNVGGESDHLSHGSFTGPLDQDDNGDHSIGQGQPNSLTPTLLLLQQHSDGRFYNKPVKGNHYPMEPILNTNKQQQQQQSITPQKMMLISRLNQSNHQQQSNGMLDHFLMQQPGSVTTTPLPNSKGHPLPTIPRDDDNQSFRSGCSSANRYEEPQFSNYNNHYHQHHQHLNHNVNHPVKSSKNSGSPHSINTGVVNGGNLAGTNSSSGSANTALTTTANEISQNESSEPDYAEPIINEFDPKSITMNNNNNNNSKFQPPSLTSVPPISISSPQSKNYRYSSEEYSDCSNIGLQYGRYEKSIKINPELIHYGYYSSLPNLGVGLYLPPEFFSNNQPNRTTTTTVVESNVVGDNLYIRYGIDIRARYPGICSLSSVITLNLSKHQQQQQIEFNRPAILCFRHCLSFHQQQQQQQQDQTWKRNLVIMWQEQQQNSSKTSKWIELIRLDDQQQQDCYAYLDSNNVYLVTRLFGRFMFGYKQDFSQYGSTNSKSNSTLESPSFGSIGRSATKNPSVESSMISKMVNFSITIEQYSQTEHLIKCFVYDNLPASILMFQNDQLPSCSESSTTTNSKITKNDQNKFIQILIGRMSDPLLLKSYNSSTKISLPPNRNSTLCFELIQQQQINPLYTRGNNIPNPRMEIPLEHLCSLGPNSMLHCSFMVPNMITTTTTTTMMDDDEDLVDDDDDDDDDQEPNSYDDNDNDSQDSVREDSGFSPTYENKPLDSKKSSKSSLLLKKNQRNLNYEIKIWQQKSENRKRFHHHHNHHNHYQSSSSSNTITLNRLNMRPLHHLPSSGRIQKYFFNDKYSRLFNDSDLKLRQLLTERLDHSIYNDDHYPWKQWAISMLMINDDNDDHHHQHGSFSYFQQQQSPSLQLLELWESKTINELMITIGDDNDGNGKIGSKRSPPQSSSRSKTMQLKELFYSKLLHQIQTTIGGSSDLIDLILGHQF
uniref:Uncharacterized protein LOC113796407 n=1 Tax=Dermatophagoides pteronyssinus TaxID=6956 RepID=A0A6P6YB21_DERPT